MGARLFTPNFILLCLGSATSCLGNGVGLIATMWWVQSSTGSALAMGSLALLKTLVALFTAPWAGVMVDRISRKRVIVFTDVIRGVVYLFFAYQAGLGKLTLSMLYAGAAINSICAQLFSPAIGASLPLLVASERVQSANALRRITEQASSALSYGLGGMMMAWLGVPMLFLIDGCSFLLSAVWESFIEIPSVGNSGKLSPESALADLQAGLAFARSDRTLSGLLSVVALVGICFVPFSLLLPMLVQDYLGAGSEVYGYITSAQSVGMVLGTLFILMTADTSRITWLIQWGIGIQATTLGMTAFLHVQTWGLHLIIYGVFGFLSSIINFTFISALQRRVPQQHLGKTLSLVNAINLGAQPLVSAISGFLADQAGLPAVFVGAAILGVLGNIRMLRIPGAINYLSPGEQDRGIGLSAAVR
jgi:DHA3 family macrolide efflux protein-like MFS transporter